jgi:hypothetical protein
MRDITLDELFGEKLDTPLWPPRAAVPAAGGLRIALWEDEVSGEFSDRGTDDDDGDADVSLSAVGSGIDAPEPKPLSEEELVRLMELIGQELPVAAQDGLTLGAAAHDESIMAVYAEARQALIPAGRCIPGELAAAATDFVLCALIGLKEGAGLSAFKEAAAHAHEQLESSVE